MSQFNIEGTLENGVLVYTDPRNGQTAHVIAPVVVSDDFTGPAVDTTNDWTFAAVNSGAIAKTAGAGGIARITTGTADDDDADLATPLIFLPSKGCSLEARIACNDVAATGFNVGFSDATGEAADLIALTFATATLTSTATDFAGFFHDSDATTAAIRAVAIKNDVDGTVASSGVAAANGTYNVYRVDISPDGSVVCKLDGVTVYSASAAITTSVALCAYIGFINREAAANTLDIDYIRAWSWSR